MNRQQAARELVTAAKELMVVGSSTPFWFVDPSGTISIYVRYKIGGYNTPKQVAGFTRTALRNVVSAANKVASMAGVKILDEREWVAPFDKATFQCSAIVELPHTEEVVLALNELRIKEVKL